MSQARARKTECVAVVMEPQMRAAVEAEAARRDTSMSSTIRALIRAQLASLASPEGHGAKVAA